MAKNKIKFVLMTFFSLLIMVSFFAQPFADASVGFKIGDSYTFTTTNNTSGSATHAGVSSNFNTNSKSTNVDKIVDFNTTSEVITYQMNGIKSNTTSDLNSSIITQALEHMFYFYYTYNNISKTSVLTAFSINLNLCQGGYLDGCFVDANWALVNSQLSKFFSDATSNVGYGGNLGDLLGNMSSYKIMGQSSLSSVASQFTSTTTSWNFEFDVNSKIYIYNATDNTFNSASNYVVSVTVSYNNNGILTDNKVTLNAQYSYTGNNGNGNELMEVQLGSGSSPGFDVFTTLFVITIVAVPVIYLRQTKYRKQN